MNSPLQLSNYFVSEFSYRTNPAYRVEASVRHEGKIHWTVQLGTGINAPDHFMLALSIVVEPSETPPPLDPYHISMRIDGAFNFASENNLSQSEKERMVCLNGCSILMGLARGFVAQATGVSTFGKYLLPPVNFVEIAKDLQSNISSASETGNITAAASTDHQEASKPNRHAL